MTDQIDLDSVIYVIFRVCSGDQDVGEWTFGSHVFRRHQEALSHQGETPEKGGNVASAVT